MNRDAIKGLSDNELEQVIRWAGEEITERSARHKQATIAKIKAMAAEVGVSVTFSGSRGGPTRSVKAVRKAAAKR
jgi:hypothetical protein